MKPRSLINAITGTSIGINYMSPYRKKPCLVLTEGNCMTKLASFNNEEAAELFMQKLTEILEIDDERSDSETR